jgi:hypothetical protein
MKVFSVAKGRATFRDPLTAHELREEIERLLELRVVAGSRN